MFSTTLKPLNVAKYAEWFQESSDSDALHLEVPSSWTSSVIQYSERRFGNRVCFCHQVHAQFGWSITDPDLTPHEKNNANNSPSIADRVVVVTETRPVSCAVGTEIVNISETNVMLQAHGQLPCSEMTCWTIEIACSPDSLLHP